MAFLLLLFFIGLAPCAVVWRWTRGLAPGRRATIRAATVALFLVPVSPPLNLQCAFVIPAWFALLTGAGERSFGDLVRTVILPAGVVFLVLSLVLRIRRSPDREGFTEKPTE